MAELDNWDAEYVSEIESLEGVAELELELNDGDEGIEIGVELRVRAVEDKLDDEDATNGELDLLDRLELMAEEFDLMHSQRRETTRSWLKR